MAYSCSILADSISPAGHRITSWECTFPRIILAEVNTHCMLSRNSASSRARPVASVIAAVLADPFVPEAFGRNQKGMQPGEALEGDEGVAVQARWLANMDHATGEAAWFADRGVHKQYANRLLEPFSWHTAVITATDVDNLFHLRVNPLAQGEFQKAARMMFEAREASTPRECLSGSISEWHLPYVTPEESFYLDANDGKTPAWKVAVGRCARVSYLTQNGVREPAEDVALADRLLESGHMSPFEHIARPMTEAELRITRTFDISIDNGPTLRSGGWSGPLGTAPDVGQKVQLGDKEATITAVRGPLHYSGKLNGWISRRAFVPGEHDILGYRNQND